ncbi:odorant receptor 67a-like isoform X2 [Photinus pyralis]|uniref:odorant receptor 67a-like isoform X2 n=1 Tax=Photinus pyralis TaxID=7054 RepID=UPI0012676A53|nr:odorant receptor 67a-like isoform X2 [Photinus pyralis]
MPLTFCLKSFTFLVRELLMLRLIGISFADNEKVSYRIYAFFCNVLLFGYPVIAFSDLFKHEFDIVADLLIYELATIMVCCEAFVVMWNRQKLKALFRKLECAPFTPNFERGGEVEESFLKDFSIVTGRQANICWGSVFSTVGMSIVATIIKRVRSSDYRDWEFTYGPLTVLDVTRSPYFEITWLYQITCVLVIGLTHCSVILIISEILGHASVQFKILQNNLSQVTENAHRIMTKKVRGVAGDEVDVSKVPWKYLQKSLNEAISYHLSILDVTSEVEKTINMLTLIIFLFSLAVTCFQVYHASILSAFNVRFLKCFTDSSSAIFPVFILCFWSHQVAHESEQVAKYAFQANFVGSDLRYQKGLNLIMVRGQRPVILKAGKFIEISLPTFVSIIRASYSAFMVLRSVNEK